jgi:hypothetical protein
VPDEKSEKSDGMSNHLLNNGFGDAILEMDDGQLFVFREFLSNISKYFESCNIPSKLRSHQSVFS